MFEGEDNHGTYGLDQSVGFLFLLFVDKPSKDEPAARELCEVLR